METISEVVDEEFVDEEDGLDDAHDNACEEAGQSLKD